MQFQVTQKRCISVYSLFLLLIVVGCNSENSSEEPPSVVQSSSSSMDMKKMSMDPGDIVFKDHVNTNVEVPKGLDGLVFFDTTGKRVALKDYLGRKNVVLVFTEGFAGMLCPFCKTQTSRLVANYDRFQETDTEVLVVYPGQRDHVEEFIEAAKTTDKVQVDSVPFPIVLDENLGATSYFNIRSNLAHPSRSLSISKEVFFSRMWELT